MQSIWDNEDSCNPAIQVSCIRTCILKYSLATIQFQNDYSHCSANLQAFMTYIRSLPINDTPEMFGLHDNANITFAMNEGYQLLNNILLLQPKSSSGGGRSREEVRLV